MLCVIKVINCPFISVAYRTRIGRFISVAREDNNTWELLIHSSFAIHSIQIFHQTYYKL